MKLIPKAEALFRLQQYGRRPAIQGVASVDLRRCSDEGGSLVELLRLAREDRPGLEGFRTAQVNYSTVQPGVTKAFHLHQRQTDVWFVPPEDRVLLVLVDVRAGSPTEGAMARELLGDGRTRLVRIPPGVAHGCRNLSPHPARIIYFTDMEFSPEPAACDEGRLPWDFVGKDVWEIPWD